MSPPTCISRMRPVDAFTHSKVLPNPKLAQSRLAVPPYYTMSSVQQKFLDEASKRRRQDGLAQFQPLHDSDDQRLQHLVADITADHAALDQLAPPARSGDRVKFLIMGAGMGGILHAVRLLQAGFARDQLVMVEVGGGVGGTWYWNRYPGLHCDVEAYTYMPLLEEMGFMPSQKYASGVEIRRYLESVVARFGLGDRIMYRTEVDALQWDEQRRAWRADMTTSRGPAGSEKASLWVHSEFVILTIGLFPRPQVPKVPGIADFEGAMFHTARWDYSVTGGSSETPFPQLDRLQDRRVGIIGTGCTGIQVVPEVAKYAKSLHVFQRTPSQVNPRRQRDTDAVEWRERIAAKPGWQAARQLNLAEQIAFGAPDDHEDLVGDELSSLETWFAVAGGAERFGVVAPDKVPERIDFLLKRDARHNQQVRNRVASIVKDKHTAEKLTPWYPTWCKRPTFSDRYLQAFNQENVYLVDTDGQGVEAITPHGVVANGKEHPVDVLIWSTGYTAPGLAAGNPSARSGIDIVGRNGRSLTDKWTAQGPTTLHGIGSNGFPNLFWMGPSQAGSTANYGHNLDILSRHVAHVVAEAHERVGDKRREGVVVEVTVAAEEAWAARIVEGAASFGAVAICTPGYLNSEGEATLPPADPASLVKRARRPAWPWGMPSYIRELRTWRDEGKLDGLEISVV